MDQAEVKSLISYLGRDGVLIRYQCQEVKIYRLMRDAGFCRKTIYREMKRFEKYADEHGLPWIKRNWNEQ